MLKYSAPWQVLCHVMEKRYTVRNFILTFLLVLIIIYISLSGLEKTIL